MTPFDPMPTDMPPDLSDVANFVQLIQNSDAYKLVQAVGPLFGYAQTLLNLLFPDDTLQQLSQRIDDLQESVNEGLAHIGYLIYQQTQQIIQNLDALKNEESLSNAYAAVQSLYDYKRLTRQGDEISASLALNSAGVASSTAIGLLLQPEQRDPFYIGGLIGCGDARIDVILAQDVNYFDNEEHIDELNGLTDLLAFMADAIVQRTTASHTVETQEIEVRDPDPHPVPGRRQGYKEIHAVHKSHGQILTSYYYANVPDSVGPTPDYTPSEAQFNVHRDYERGIVAELDFLLVPKYRGILSSWQGLKSPKWSAWHQLGDFETSVPPAAAVFKGLLYVVAPRLDRRMFVTSTADTHNWTVWAEVGGQGHSDCALAAAVFLNRLFLFAKHISDNKICVNSTEDGHFDQGWQVVGGGGRTDAAPTAVVFRDRMYVFVKGIGNNRIYVNSTADGDNFDRGWQEVGGDGRTDAAPSAVVFGARMYLFVKGLGNNLIYVNSTADGDNFDRGWQEVDGEASTDAAAAAIVVEDRTYVYRKDLGNDRIFFTSTSDGSNFARVWREVGVDGVTDVAPAANLFNGRPCVLRKGMDGTIGLSYR